MKKCKIPSSFDVIGSKEGAVAIIDFDKGAERIAKAIMERNSNIKTVLNKKTPRKGKFRLNKYELVAGRKKTEVIHKESGCRFKIDPKKVYFSPREITERMRIAEMVKKNETVVVFFAGAGPFAVVIGRHSKPKKIIGIELNPKAVDYFKENAKLNKLGNIEIVLGDVKEKSKKYYGKCDRVLMPLPETAIDYIEYAMRCLKKNGICHLYAFVKNEDISEFKIKIRDESKKLKRKIRFLKNQKVLPWGPGIYKTRIDFKVV